jgi:signal peptidase
MVIHRVLTVSTDTAGRRVFTTKGDNNDVADAPVDGYQVRAALWYRLPLLGWVNNWLDASMRRTVAVGFAVLAFGWAAWNLAQTLRARRARRAEAGLVGGEARGAEPDAGGRRHGVSGAGVSAAGDGPVDGQAAGTGFAGGLRHGAADPGAGAGVSGLAADRAVDGLVGRD